MTGFPPNNYFLQSRRPIPKFDMDLRDLFTEDETDKGSFSRISNQITGMRPPQLMQQQQQQQQDRQDARQQQHQHQQQMHTFNPDLKISPQLQTHHQQLQQQQQQQQQHRQQTSYPFDPNSQPLPSPHTYPSTTSPAMSLPPAPSPYQITNTLPYTAFSQQIASTYPDIGFSDLDFLDSFPVQGGSSDAGGAGGAAGDPTGGLQDLGFGMGLGFADGTHDWSEGGGFDLFDGFFFGPQG